jgi:beta-1,2-mannobiose phosphorylase / 1,2-beta-oligomannan phosphorylase
MDALSLEPRQLLLILGALFLLCLLLALYWIVKVGKPLVLLRERKNPVLQPDPKHWWESQAVFNPGAVVWGGKIHLFYRAIGSDGVSRVGYAQSGDGIHFERQNEPCYDPPHEAVARAAAARKGTRLTYATLTYDTVTYGSGGGWGGSEDPRAVILDGRLYLSFTSFEGWNNERIGLASIPVAELAQQKFLWDSGYYLSKPNEVQKNWLLFPEKIHGKYAVLHSISPTIDIAYRDRLEDVGGIEPYIESYQGPRKGGRVGKWDERVRGAGTPPIKTEYGWLVLYHGTNGDQSSGYQVGAMLLDLEDPTVVLYRSEQPILTPEEWYENDWKPRVVYASGAVVFNGDLLVYYGGGDKYVAAARANLRDFLRKLVSHQHASLEPVEV